MRSAPLLLTVALVLLEAAFAGASEPGPSEAARLFYEAEAKYAGGDVRGALRAMERSFELSGHAELLFNLGELHRELGDCGAARVAYERYLREVSEPKYRDRAETALAAARVCPPPVAPVPVPAEPPATPSHTAQALELRDRGASPSHGYWTGSRILGWSLIGAGVAAGVCSAYFTLEARSLESSLEAAVAENQRRPSAERRPWEEVGQQRYADGQRAATLAYAFGAGALAAAVGGVGLLWFGGPAQPGSTARAGTVSITVAPDALSGAWSVTF